MHCSVYESFECGIFLGSYHEYPLSLDVHVQHEAVLLHRPRLFCLN